MSPAQNLEILGLETDANNIICSKPDASINPKFKAFVGFTESDETTDVETKKKIKILDEFDMKYCKDLIEKYKLSYDAMFKDIKLNYNQLTANKLKKLCLVYLHQTNQSTDDYIIDV